VATDKRLTTFQKQNAPPKPRHIFASRQGVTSQKSLHLREHQFLHSIAYFNPVRHVTIKTTTRKLNLCIWHCLE
jgi:hypothetical protein